MEKRGYNKNSSAWFTIYMVLFGIVCQCYYMIYLVTVCGKCICIQPLVEYEIWQIDLKGRNIVLYLKYTCCVSPLFLQTRYCTSIMTWLGAYLLNHQHLNTMPLDSPTIPGAKAFLNQFDCQSVSANSYADSCYTPFFKYVVAFSLWYYPSAVAMIFIVFESTNI